MQRQYQFKRTMEARAARQGYKLDEAANAREVLKVVHAVEVRPMHGSEAVSEGDTTASTGAQAVAIKKELDSATKEEAAASVGKAPAAAFVGEQTDEAPGIDREEITDKGEEAVAKALEAVGIIVGKELARARRRRMQSKLVFEHQQTPPGDYFSTANRQVCGS